MRQTTKTGCTIPEIDGSRKPHGSLGARRRGQNGFTLLEVVVSTGLLSVAVLGLAMTIPVATQSNHRNRVDAEGSMLVQRQLEQMISQSLTATTFTDASGNVISLVAGGSTVEGGEIDFSGEPVAGYNTTATGSSGSQYELRWNVVSLGDGSKQFTMGARKTGDERFLLPPVTLSVRQGK